MKLSQKLKNINLLTSNIGSHATTTSF